jgi:hypothetical protein
VGGEGFGFYDLLCMKWLHHSQGHKKHLEKSPAAITD